LARLRAKTHDVRGVDEKSLVRVRHIISTVSTLPPGVKSLSFILQFRCGGC
jgi:hypothetical protein